MPDKPLNGNGRSTPGNSARNYARLTGSDRCSGGGMSEDRFSFEESEFGDRARLTDKCSRRPDWQGILLWLFVTGIVIFSLAAGYLIWAKCRGASVG